MRNHSLRHLSSGRCDVQYKIGVIVLRREHTSILSGSLPSMEGSEAIFTKGTAIQNSYQGSETCFH